MMCTIRGHRKLISVSVLLQSTVGLLLLNLSEQEYIKESCNQVTGDVTYCNYLYTNEEGITWDTAAQKCSESNKTLAVISNESRKTVASGLVAELDDKIWIGGRRSENNSWTYIDNHKTEMLNGAFPSTKYCAMRQSLNTGLLSTPCVENHLALCQYPPGPNTVCAEEGILYDDRVCLKASQETMSWFEARNYCKGINAGDLSVISADLSFLESLRSDFGYWIGLQRRPWIWTPDKRPIDLFMFDAGEGSDGSQSCLALVRPEDGATAWSDVSCDENLKYYMCETESSPPVDKADATAETQDDNTVATVYIIVGVILAAICLTVAIVVAILVRRRSLRKRDAKDRQTEEAIKPASNVKVAVRPEISQPIPMQASFRVSEYDNLGALIPVKSDPDGRNNLPTIADTTPDGATCTGEAPNHVMLNNGDEYAVVNKRDNDLSDFSIYSKQ